MTDQRKGMNQMNGTGCKGKDIHESIHGKHMGNAAVLGMVLHQCMEQSKKIFEKYGLKKSYAGILFLMEQNPHITQKDLAVRLQVKPPSVTAAIKEMEKSGYVIRSANKDDMRENRLALTEKGRGCIDSIKQAASSLDSIMFEGIDEKERQQFREILLKIHENLKNRVSHK